LPFDSGTLETQVTCTEPGVLANTLTAFGL
jgi:hypothetical protein